MKINMNQKFKDLINGGFVKNERIVECGNCGTDIRIPVGVYVGGSGEAINKCPVCRVDFEIPTEIKYTTLGSVSVDALLRVVEKDTGEDETSKRKRAKLADKIIDAIEADGIAELEDNKEAVLIEKRIEKIYPPMITRQASLMLNEKRKEEDNKKE